jgi:1-phosphofructokinase family hexose kinase
LWASAARVKAWLVFARWKDGDVLLILSLAPALDRYAVAAHFRRAEINRPRTVTALAGGKGLNAARTAVRLGVPTRTVTLVGGATGDTLRRLAAAEGLDVTWVDSDVETRQCLSLLDESDGSLTELYEPVLPVSPSVWPAFVSAAASSLATLASTDVVAVSGRVPSGLPSDAIAQLVGLCVDAGVQVLVDSDGDQLARAAARRPTLVKVNASEAAAATGTSPSKPWDGASALQSLGAGTVVVTLGAGGALCLAADGRRLEVLHAPLEDALPVGSGDAFLAGLASGFLGSSFDLAEALRYAAGAGRANARHLQAGSCTPESVASELPAIAVRVV